jgi:hypothetical protein
MTGQVPYIRCPRGNAAEMIARKLESKIRDHLHGSSTARSSGGPGLFSQSEGSGLGGLSRPGMYPSSPFEWSTYCFWGSIDSMGQEPRSRPNAFSFMDVPSSSARRDGYEAKQGYYVSKLLDLRLVMYGWF